MKINHPIIAYIVRILLCIGMLLMAYCCGYAQCNTGLNVAQGKTATASSLENSGYPASYAFDGNNGSRWSSGYSDNEYIYVDLGTSYPLCRVQLTWEAAYGKNFTIDISSNASTWTTAATITGNSSLSNTISISGTARYVRMKGTLRATGYGYSLYEFQVYSTNTSPACPSTNIAQNRPGIISSLENAIFPASNAFDGDPTTRWSSAFSDPQSIYVDLGTPYVLCGVDLTWENAYASNFEIDGSNNAVTWTTLSNVVGNTSLNNTLSVSGSYRYVRMYGTARATGYGYSLYEFAVHGSATLPVEISNFSATEIKPGTVSVNWVTSLENAGRSFIIQRSSDAVLFDSVGFAEGSSPGNYTFNDNVTGGGMYSYRLKQTGADGKVDFSPIVLVQVAAGSTPTLFLSPNPATTWFTLKGRGIRENADVRITDVSGNLVKQFKQVSPAQALSVSSLAPGLYIVSVKTPSRYNTLKLIKR